jgi:hypothetical protein
MSESDRRGTLPATAASAQETGVPPIAGTPWDMIQADLEHDGRITSELIVI